MSRIIQFATKYPLGTALVVSMCWGIVSTVLWFTGVLSEHVVGDYLWPITGMLFVFIFGASFLLRLLPKIGNHSLSTGNQIRDEAAMR